MIDEVVEEGDVPVHGQYGSVVTDPVSQPEGHGATAGAQLGAPPSLPDVKVLE
jgi:hypothetical protein